MQKRTSKGPAGGQPVVIESRGSFQTVWLDGKISFAFDGECRLTAVTSNDQVPLFTLERRGSEVVVLAPQESDLLLNGLPLQKSTTHLMGGDRLVIGEHLLHLPPAPGWESSDLVPGWGSRTPPISLEFEIHEASEDPSRCFERYLILSELGRGGFGCVYRAWDPRLERLVAIKILLRANNPQARKRFIREVHATARLRHAGIVVIHDSGEVRDLPYLVMDFVEGRTLEELAYDLIRTPPKQRAVRAARLLRDVARAVAHAHGKGILHRDLKPANVMVAANDVVTVTDFGLAHLSDVDLETLTETGAGLGTPMYMAPEQMGGTEMNERLDFYGLGGTLFCVLTGQPPFEGNSLPTLWEAKAQPRVPSQLDPELPSALDEICRSCLSPDPSERYRDASEVADALDRFLESATPEGGASARSWLITLATALGVALVGLIPLVYWALRTSPDGAPFPPVTPPSATVDEPALEDRRELQEVLELSGAARERGDFSTALKHADEALLLVPDDLSALVQRAQILLMAKRFEDAGEAVERARAVAPTDPRVLRILAALRFQAGDPEGCVEAIQVLIDQGVAEGNDIVNRAKAFRQLERYQLALLDYATALRLEPNTPEAGLGRIRTYRHLGQQVEALEAANTAVGVWPSNATVRLERGLVWEATGRLDQALLDYAWAVELAPGLATAWIRLDETAVTLKDPTTILEVADRILRKDPTAHSALFYGALQEARLSRFNKVQERLDRALVLKPRHAGSYYVRGVARSRRGDEPGAIADLERFLELDSTSDSTKAARALLERLRGDR